MVMGLLYRIVSRSAFGKALPEKDVTTSVIKKAVNIFEGYSVPDLFPNVKILEVITGARSRLMKLHKEVDAMIEEVIREHRERRKKKKNETDDIVDVLLNLQEQGNLDIPLKTDDIKGVIMDMFLAGVETTSTLTEWTISELAKNPKIMKKAQEEVRRAYEVKGKVEETELQDLPYLNAIIKETLRLHPPAALLAPRETTERVSLCGFEIPEKTRVLINVWAIGRDPRNWNDPEKFDPERFMNSSIDYKGTHFEYTPFGAGRRMCPGILYGLSVVQLVIASLVYHFEWRVPDVAGPEDLDMTEAFGAVTRRKKELCLIPTIYAHQ